MKNNREHRVALSTAALAVLHDMAAYRISAYVFPGRFPGRPINNNVMSRLLYRMGYRGTATIHGFRSTFRDWTAETTNFAGELAELALSHRNDSTVEAAYRRGDQLEKRRPLMEAWGRFVIGDSNVVALPTNKHRA
jgi:integrase